jgi:hypothetical protein
VAVSQDGVTSLTLRWLSKEEAQSAGVQASGVVGAMKPRVPSWLDVRAREFDLGEDLQKIKETHDSPP